MNSKGQPLIFEFASKLKDLARDHDLIRTYPPADPKMVNRRFSHIPGRPDQNLMEFFQYSNGASLLDYCIVGCNNRRIADLEHVRNGVYVRDWQRDRPFIPFVVTSVGEFFGYLVSSDSIHDLPVHPVAYCRDSENDPPILISSSVALFLLGLLDDVELQLRRDPSSVGVDLKGWPCVLEHWLARDPELADLV